MSRRALNPKGCQSVAGGRRAGGERPQGGNRNGVNAPWRGARNVVVGGAFSSLYCRLVFSAKECRVLAPRPGCARNRTRVSGGRSPRWPWNDYRLRSGYPSDCLRRSVHALEFRHGLHDSPGPDHPTLPSRLTPSSFCASTANSIGSSRKTSLQKPLMIMFTASWVEMPRWLQ